jgi:endothelin-converting enzyme
LTSGENAGDAGLRVAWKAWKDSLAAEGHHQQKLKLPGLADYTDEQLFFLAFGRIWASTSTPASAKVSSPLRSSPALPHS